MDMNPWFDRLAAELLGSLGTSAQAACALSAEEADMILSLSGDVAHGSGVRQYAPLVSFIAGRLVQQFEASRPAAMVIEDLRAAVIASGAAGEEEAKTPAT